MSQYSLERKRDGQEIAKLLRLQRIKDLREQEKLLGRERCAMYRASIADNKKSKRIVARAKKLKEMQTTHDDVAKKWRKSLVDTGAAHREADETAVQTWVKQVDHDKENRQKQKLVECRQKDALKDVTRSNKAAQKVQDRQREQRLAMLDLQASNREDARRAAEARIAKEEAKARNRMNLENQVGPLIIKQADAKQSASSAKLMQSSSIAVQAKVMKHGATKADITVVQNDAKKAEVLSYKKIYSRVIDEMKNKIKAKNRARVAVKSSAIIRNVDVLESELTILHTLDRNGARQTRLKSATSVHSNEESPAVTQAFENVFLATKDRDSDSIDDRITEDSDSIKSSEYSDDLDEKKEENESRKNSNSEVMTTSKRSKVNFNVEMNSIHNIEERNHSDENIDKHDSTSNVRKNDSVIKKPHAPIKSSIPKSSPARTSSAPKNTTSIMGFSNPISNVNIAVISDDMTRNSDENLFGSDIPLPPQWGHDNRYHDVLSDDMSVEFDSGSEFSGLPSNSEISVESIGEVEITRNSIMMDQSNTYPLVGSLPELCVSFSSEENFKILKNDNKMNTSWLSSSVGYSSSNSIASNLSKSDSSNASTDTARHDIIDERESSSVLSTTNSVDSDNFHQVFELVQTEPTDTTCTSISSPPNDDEYIYKMAEEIEECKEIKNDLREDSIQDSCSTSSYSSKNSKNHSVTEEDVSSSRSLTVRVDGNIGIFSTGDSVSFESLFIEDEEEDEEESENIFTEEDDGGAQRTPTSVTSGGSSQFNLSGFVNKYADKSPIKNKTMDGSDDDGDDYDNASEDNNDVQENVVVNDEMVRTYATHDSFVELQRSLIDQTSSVHSKSLREVLGIRESLDKYVNRINNIRPYNSSDDSHSELSDDSSLQFGSGKNIKLDSYGFDNEEIDLVKEDDGDDDATLVNEIDEMRARLLNAVQLSAMSSFGDTKVGESYESTESMSAYDLSSNMGSMTSSLEQFSMDINQSGFRPGLMGASTSSATMDSLLEQYLSTTSSHLSNRSQLLSSRVEQESTLSSGLLPELHESFEVSDSDSAVSV